MRFWKRILVSFLGSVVLLLGIAMIVLPGPALVVVPMGLAILGSEFAWAQRLLDRFRQHFARAAVRLTRRVTPAE